MEDQSQTREFEDGLDLLLPGVRDRIRVLFRIREELSKESDRGCALLAAAYLDCEAGTLLRRFFALQDASAERLFEFNGPVGTFSAKIDMAAALGLVSSTVQRDLNLVRKVRNDFAHLETPVSFESPKIRDRVRSFWPKEAKIEGRCRELFVQRVQGIAAALHTQLARTHSRPILEDEDIAVCESSEAYELEIAARTVVVNDSETACM